MTRIDLVLAVPPLSPRCIEALDRIERSLEADIPEVLRDGSQFSFSGPAATIRDLRTVSRVEDERKTRGPVQGVLQARARTGRIISTCGFIMAGTFAALFAGSFLGMKQLGFALAAGVLLDTLVVRPILVPTSWILLHGRGSADKASGKAAQSEQIVPAAIRE